VRNSPALSCDIVKAVSRDERDGEEAPAGRPRR
jgi:hypothetical protein